MREFRVSKRGRFGTLVVHNASWFFRLVPAYLFDEKAVADVIDRVAQEGLRHEGQATNVRVDLDMRHSFGTPPEAQP